MIDAMLTSLVQREGGYVNDPRDAGGETNFGITKETALRNGYAGSMKTMTVAMAKGIYSREYWTTPRFDKVAERYPRVGEELFDTGVNMGPAVAAAFFQRVLNVQEGIQVTADGAIGAGTLAALDAFKAKRGAAGESWLLKALDALQGERYIELAEKRQANEAFVYGWIANRLGNA
jgi:lysozyme family protein